MINLGELWMTQKSLKRSDAIPGMIKDLKDVFFPPIQINRTPDGSLEIHDGHHRAVAYWLSGKRILDLEDYLIVEVETAKPRFWQLKNSPYKSKVATT